MNSEPVLSEQKTQSITWILLLFMPIIGMAVDLIAPSLPAIASDLNVSNHLVKNTIAIYLAGYALGNFITGFLTDALGRKKLLRISLFAFALTSFIPVLYPSISVLLTVRFFQGVTIGAVSVLIRAIFSDIHCAEKLVKLGTLLGTMWGLGPVLGPVLGGYFQVYFGWQAGFYFFSIISFVSLAVIFLVLPETHFNRHPLHIAQIKKDLIEVLTHRLFMSLVILMGLAYSLLIVFNTMAPFLIQTILHYSPVFFGHLAFYLGCVFLVATFICRYLLSQYPIKQLYFVLVNLPLFLAVLLLAVTFVLSKNIILIACASGLMFFTCGFLFPISMGKGMSLFKHIAGTAAAIMFLVNVLITSLFSMMISFLAIHNFIYLMSVNFILLLGCGLIYWVILRKTL